MQSFLFTNTFFEEELSNNIPLTPDQFLQKHPLYFQLQYLSCLIADSSEIPLFSHAPDAKHLNHLRNLGFSCPSFALLSDFPSTSSYLSSWGPSSSLANWATKKNCSYTIPSLDIVKKVHSKEFSFFNCPQLDSSRLITTQEELISWWDFCTGPKVLKTLYGSSGRGHCISADPSEGPSKALAFFSKNQKNSPSLIAQPWVERILDFSTQWLIEKDGSFSYLGATLCENSSKGTYLKSTTGPENLLFENHIDFFYEHQMHAKKAIEKLIALSFFGNVGFDAFLYKHPQSKQIHLFPIVEINARKTMGWVALKIAHKLSLDQLISIRYQSKAESSLGLLPSRSESIPFPKQLILETNPVCI